MLTAPALLRRVARSLATPVTQLTNRSRSPRLVRERARACWLLRQHGLSLPEIATVMQRDHSTVLYHIRAVDAAAACDAAYATVLRGLLAQTRQTRRGCR